MENVEKYNDIIDKVYDLSYEKLLEVAKIVYSKERFIDVLSRELRDYRFFEKGQKIIESVTKLVKK